MKTLILTKKPKKTLTLKKKQSPIKRRPKTYRVA